MSINLLILTTAIYFYVGIEQLLKGNTPMAITFTAYAAANIGLILANKQFKAPAGQSLALTQQKMLFF